LWAQITLSGVQAVVLVPTNGLTTQVLEQFQTLMVHCDELLSAEALSGKSEKIEK